MKLVGLEVLIAGACTTSSDRSESATNTSPANTNATDEAAEPPISRSCNTEIADAQAAIDLAAQAKRTANFPDEHEVDGPKALVAEGFRLSPMVPAQWPPVDCAVVFYVFEMSWFSAESVRDRREAVAARVIVRLDTGKVEVVAINNAPGHGGWLLYGGGGMLEADRQRWVFDAVASSTASAPGVDVAVYKEWLNAEVSVAPAVFVWHREFFDFVVGDDELIMRQVEANSLRR